MEGDGADCSVRKRKGSELEGTHEVKVKLCTETKEKAAFSQCVDVRFLDKDESGSCHVHSRSKQAVLENSESAYDELLSLQKQDEGDNSSKVKGAKTEYADTKFARERTKGLLSVDMPSVDMSNVVLKNVEEEHQDFLLQTTARHLRDSIHCTHVGKCPSLSSACL